MTITRKTERRRAIRNAASVAAAVSLLCHLLLLAWLAPAWLEQLAEEPPGPVPDRELEIEAVYEEPPTPDPTEVVEQVHVAPQVEVEPEVELTAEISDATSETAMMVASAEPAETFEPIEQAEPPPVAAAEEEVAEAVPPPIEEQSPVILQQPKPTPQNLLMPDAATYEQMFAQRDVEASERARENGRGKVLFKNYEKTKQGVRASLESFGHDVRPGNHTGVNPKSGAFGSYIGVIHRKIHARWANGYLMDLDLREPPGSAMNDPTLNAKLEFVILAETGELEAVNIVNSSGQVRFDAQAIAIAHSTGPHPNPPAELVSPNGKVYVHWNFWRDQRQCGVFGASIFIVGEQGSPG